MGLYGYTKEDFLSQQRDISATRFSVPGHIAPITLEGTSETVEFWTEGRYPQWAGEGERRNHVDERIGRAGVRANRRR